MIKARLFGGFELKGSNDETIALSTRKARALFAFLVVESDRWHPRDKLAGLLWGDREQAQARNSLNQALHEIRKLEAASGIQVLRSEPDRIRVVEDTIVSDVCQFNQLLRDNAIHAADFRGGELLEDLDLREPVFSEWLGTKRSELDSGLAESLRSLAYAGDGNDDSNLATQAARRLLSLDPLDEIARRHLMQLLAQAGNRAEAIRQYEIGASLLQQELGVEPDWETQQLLEQIKRAHPAAPAAIDVKPDTNQDLIDTPATAERPVIAVMPFQNLDDSPDFALVADGLAEDIIFELSAHRAFRVLARSATFCMRETEFGHSDIQRVFGADYAVSGRIRRFGRKLRVSVELFECKGGEQIWSERYDKPLEELFDIEVDISRRVAASIEPALEGKVMRRVLGRPPESLEAYELLQRGYWHIYRGTAEDDAEALRFIEAAISKDPAFAGAIAALAFLKYRDAHANLTDNFVGRMEDCRTTATQALELDPRDPRALRFYSGACYYLGQHDAAMTAAERSVELCPSYATGHSGLAFAHNFAGSFADAKPAADETIRLRPYDPLLHRCIMSKSLADYQTGDYERSERVTRESLRVNDRWWFSNMMLAACLGRLGKADAAREPIEKLKSYYAGLSLEIFEQELPFVDPSHRDHLTEGLIKAGWRDQ